METGESARGAGFWFLRLGILLLLLLLVGKLVARLDRGELLLRLASADRWLLLAAVVCLFARLLLWDRRWGLAMARLDLPVRRRDTLPALLGALLLNTVTPTGRIAGGLFRARHGVERGEAAYSEVFGSVLYDQIIHQLVALAATLVGLMGLGWATGRWWLVVLGGSTLGLGALLLQWLPRSGRRTAWGRLMRYLGGRIERRGGRALALLEGGRGSMQGIRSLVRSKRLAVAMVAVSGAMVLLVSWALWWSAQALDLSIGFVSCVFAVALGTALGGLLGTPGGVGGVEAGTVMALVSLGTSQADAVAATLVFRGLHYAVVLVAGLPALVWSEATRGKVVEAP